MRQWEQDVTAVFNRLMNGPFQGTAWELGQECGIGYDRLMMVFHIVRKAEWIDEHHWTIPYVTRGRAINTWQIVDSASMADNATMTNSLNNRAWEMHGTTVRNIAQSRLALAAVDGRTVRGKHWNNVLVSLEATRAHLELIIT